MINCNECLMLDEKVVAKVLPTPEECVQWVVDILTRKSECILPPKISLHFAECNFFNTMPSQIPWIDRMGVKAIIRVIGRKPTVQGDLMLYEMSSGKLLSIMDATLITQWRTGAVAAHSLNIFGKKNGVLAMLGLGATARTTLKSFLAAYPSNRPVQIKLLRYKDQAERFIEEFDKERLDFKIIDSIPDLIRDSDSIVSCVTAFDGPIADDSLFKSGCTVIPVHTRGFQNCDLFFDKVFADDRGTVCHFGNFDKFRYFGEVASVLSGGGTDLISRTNSCLQYWIKLA